MEEFDCLQSYVGVPLAGELRRDLQVTIGSINIRPREHAPD